MKQFFLYVWCSLAPDYEEISFRHFFNCYKPIIWSVCNTGTGNLRNSIWWFNWDGFTVANGESRFFVLDDGLNVTITFSSVTFQVPMPNVTNYLANGSYFIALICII
jgi:hypothetical protein